MCLGNCSLPYCLPSSSNLGVAGDECVGFIYQHSPSTLQKPVLFFTSCRLPSLVFSYFCRLLVLEIDSAVITMQVVNQPSKHVMMLYHTDQTALHNFLICA